ncbi:hypothetical protein VB773_08660 [Haloarculaceae archaeon H-GB2-1]|nr:hypothetical protein [Haloarculaceae archaeon H-GB11]MEA5407630.1 hypothetical protein [Haloarculaceae archaeon H-GB2-1]
MTDRGQTTQDYVIGISLVLITLVSVFVVVPTYFAPFDDPVDTEERAMAQAVAEHLVETHSVGTREHTLDYSSLTDALDDESDVTALKDKGDSGSERGSTSTSRRLAER